MSSHGVAASLSSPSTTSSRIFSPIPIATHALPVSPLASPRISSTLFHALLTPDSLAPPGTRDEEAQRDGRRMRKERDAEGQAEGQAKGDVDEEGCR